MYVCMYLCHNLKLCESMCVSKGVHGRGSDYRSVSVVYHNGCEEDCLETQCPMVVGSCRS